jgi:hypothetical protein
MENIERYGIASVILLLILKELIALYKGRIKKGDNTEAKLLTLVTDNMSSGFDKLNNTLQEIKFIAYKTTLAKHEVMQIVSDKFQIHIRKKQNVLNDVLEKNNLKTRRCQIEQRIRTEFMEITRQECSEMNIFNTKIGAVGTIINDLIDWTKFLGSIYEIIFSEEEKKTKLRDTENLMNGYVSEIKGKIEDILVARERNSESFCE